MIRLFSAMAVIGALLAAYSFATACPFCPAVKATLAEDIDAADVSLICKLVHRPDADADAAGAAPECTFEVLEVIKGEAILAAAPGATKPYQIKILYFEDRPLGTKFIVSGIDATNTSWATPTPAGEPALAYFRKLNTLPKEPVERLPFFADYFEHPDPLVAKDAYDEFARAPYADLQRLKDRLPREKLWAWVGDPNVTTAHRRQYLCLLSICGLPEDVPKLEALIRNNDEVTRPALDALIGCYLVLRGEEGMTQIEDLFLKNPNAEYADTHSAITALRFIGQDTTAVSKERLLAGFRCLLDRPKYADMIIPDLTRAQDWSVVAKLVELFKTGDEKEGTAWSRVAIANYLRICPLPEAKVRLAELEKLDPDAVKRAEFFFGGAEVPPPGAVRGNSE